MKNFYFAATWLLCVSVATAQVNQNRCGTFDLIKYYDQLNPGYKARVDACFDNAKQLSNATRNSRATNDTIYKIQVVFHIVYNNAAENIPDSVIYSQLEVLNEDYRRLNADTFMTRDEFKPLAADAGIEFELATVDPDGNPTSGIIHTQRPTPGFLGYEPFSDNVKSFASGGVDPWPTDRYLNIWVCNVFNGLGVLGYAFPPSNAPGWPNGSTTDSAKQGVVLHYPAVGRNYSAPIDTTVDKGRSAVHEIGHYLGLRHIWGDGPCGDDDGISDTPDAADASRQTCDTTVNSCPDSPVDFQDMIENYMDYSDDRCLNMFTWEQVGLMRAMLQTSRAGIAKVEIKNTTTGIHNLSFNNITLFPNPATGLVNLNVQVKGTNTYSYAIYNAIGQTVIAESHLPAHTNHRSIDLSAEPAGIYFAKISSGDAVVVKKFQLQR